MGRVEGKVAFVTGAARGQGRGHALKLAAEGADLLLVDICDDIDSVGAPLGTRAELAETARMVEALGRAVVEVPADVRDSASLQAAIDQGMERLGRLDIVVANAGICTLQPWSEVTEQVWQDVIDVNLTGVWNTCRLTIPHLIDAGGGSIIITSSVAGLKGLPFLVPYAASKHGVVGVMRALANELGKHMIRVNTVHPTGVDTPMVSGMATMPELIEADPDLGPILMNTLPIEMVEVEDIANAVLFLASDESRYITGLEMKVDAGATAR